MTKRFLTAASLIGGLAASGAWIMRAQNPFQNPTGTDVRISHADCAYFGPQHDRFVPHDRSQLGALTARVTGMLGTSVQGGQSSSAQAHAASGISQTTSAPGGSRTYNSSSTTSSSNLIDFYIFQAFQQNGAIPAAPTNDYEF